MATLFVFTAILAREAALCFRWCGSKIAPESAESLLNKALSILEQSDALIKPILAKTV
jgi:hypothetical protein